MKVLIIGFGSIGKRHAEVLSSISEIESIHIVSKQENLKFVKYETLEDIQDLNDYDYFVISSITSLHLKQLQYIDKSVLNKIILVEKPLATEYINIELRNTVFVAYNLRFHPVIKILNDLIQNEKILNINIQTGQYLPTWRQERDYTQSYSASSEKGGGVLLDLSHEIDYLLWLFGDIQSISSLNSKISNLKIDSDDFVTAIGRMESGALFNFSMDYISKIFKRQICINTERYTIEADLINNYIYCADKSCNKKEIQIPEFNGDTSYRLMHKQTIQLAKGNHVATFNDGLKVLSIVDKIRKECYGI